MKNALVVLCLWGNCHPVPTSAAECVLAHHVTAGEAAPCTGDLLPVSEVVRLLNTESDLKAAEKSLAAEKVLRARDKTEANELLQICNESLGACERSHAPLPCPEPAWYESPWFGAAVGLVVGSVTAAVLVGELK